ncbi:MAG: hypothetical protein H0V36_06965, partial [Chloroflexi bacterium]|nr:hypothetical protein [Chloroflexota bacterium]
FLDADDRLLPNAVADGLAAFAEHPEAAFVAGPHRLIDSDGVPMSASIDEAPTYPVDHHYRELLRDNYIWMPGTVMFRRAVFEIVGGFTEGVDASADYDLYLRIAHDLPIHCHDSVVGEYRRHEGAMSRDPERMLRAILTTLRAQWPIARESKDTRAAYRAGWASWTQRYGDELTRDVKDQLAKGDWGASLHGVRSLLGLYPRGLRHLR